MMWSRLLVVLLTSALCGCVASVDRSDDDDSTVTGSDNDDSIDDDDLSDDDDTPPADLDGDGYSVEDGD